MDKILWKIVIGGMVAIVAYISVMAVIVSFSEGGIAIGILALLFAIVINAFVALMFFGFEGED